MDYLLTRMPQNKTVVHAAGVKMKATEKKTNCV